jgi:alpha-2-macroglobulin
LRGVFVAEGVQGQVTAVVRKEAAEYAFYRGTSYVGQPPVPPAPANRAQGGEGQPPPMPNQPPQMPVLNQALDANLRMQNTSNNLKQIRRLQERYRNPESDKAKGAPVGQFR